MRHEGELQCHLEESHRNCDLLRTRLEELLLFMEDLLPLIDTTNTPMRLASLRGKLNETRSLLADVSQSFNSKLSYCRLPCNIVITKFLLLLVWIYCVQRLVYLTLSMP